MKRKPKSNNKKMEPKTRQQKKQKQQQQQQTLQKQKDSQNTQNQNQNPPSDPNSNSSLAYYLLVVPPGASPPAGAAALSGTPPPAATAAAAEAVKRIASGGGGGGGGGVETDGVSGSEEQGVSRDPDPAQGLSGRGRKSRFKRHTPHQIQELESYFIKNPHPDDKAREELSRDLGLEPSQVKFWFQNKRTQLKNQFVWQENTQLRAELDKLKAENEKLIKENKQYKVMLAGTSCSACGASVVPGEVSSEEHRPSSGTIPPPEPCEEDDEFHVTDGCN